MGTLRDKNRRRRNRALVKLIKATNPCQDCGSTINLTFDHLRKSEKKFDIGSAGKVTSGALQRELLKCELVCRSCHDGRERHRSITHTH